MKDIDDKIRAALESSDASEELFAEQNIIAEAVAPFRGKRRWLNVVGLLYGIFGLGLAIWAGFKFAAAEAVREQILWMGVCLLGILFNAFLKVYFWMEMHSNRILREVKRVELLLLQKQDKG